MSKKMFCSKWYTGRQYKQLWQNQWKVFRSTPRKIFRSVPLFLVEITEIRGENNFAGTSQKYLAQFQWKCDFWKTSQILLWLKRLHWTLIELFLTKQLKTTSLKVRKNFRFNKLSLIQSCYAREEVSFEGASQTHLSQIQWKCKFWKSSQILFSLERIYWTHIELVQTKRKNKSKTFRQKLRIKSLGLKNYF